MWGKCKLLVLAYRNLYAQEGLCLHAPRHTTLRTCVYVSTKLVGPEHVVCPCGFNNCVQTSESEHKADTVLNRV